MVIAIGFIVMYVVYVIMVVVQSKYQEGIEDTNEEVIRAESAVHDINVLKRKL